MANQMIFFQTTAIMRCNTSRAIDHYAIVPIMQWPRIRHYAVVVVIVIVVVAAAAAALEYKVEVLLLQLPLLLFDVCCSCHSF
jgi:hypothetical protein